MNLNGLTSQTNFHIVSDQGKGNIAFQPSGKALEIPSGPVVMDGGTFGGSRGPIDYNSLNPRATGLNLNDKASALKLALGGGVSQRQDPYQQPGGSEGPTGYGGNLRPYDAAPDTQYDPAHNSEGPWGFGGIMSNPGMRDDLLRERSGNGSAMIPPPPGIDPRAMS